jgi:hypothetical protein
MPESITHGSLIFWSNLLVEPNAKVRVFANFAVSQEEKDQEALEDAASRRFTLSCPLASPMLH